MEDQYQENLFQNFQSDRLMSTRVLDSRLWIVIFSVFTYMILAFKVSNAQHLYSLKELPLKCIRNKGFSCMIYPFWNVLCNFPAFSKTAGTNATSKHIQHPIYIFVPLLLTTCNIQHRPFLIFKPITDILLRSNTDVQI